MNIFIRIELEPGERTIKCEGCGEEIVIDPRKFQLILGDCSICDCSIGMPITDFDVVGGERH